MSLLFFAAILGCAGFVALKKGPRFLRLILTLLLVLGLLAGCTPPPAQSSPTPSVTVSASPTATPTVSPTATASPKPSPTVKPSLTASPTPTVAPVTRATPTPTPSPTAKPTPEPTVEAKVSEPVGEIVFIAPYSGTKYHRSENCRSLKKARSVESLTRSEAVEQGYDPCKICY